MTHWARARSTHNQILLGKGRKRKREGEGVKRRTSLSPFLVHDAMTAFATADGLAWFNLVFGATIWKNGGCGIFFFSRDSKEVGGECVMNGIVCVHRVCTRNSLI